MKNFSPQMYDHALSKDKVHKDEAKTVTSPIYNKDVTDKVELAEQVEYVIKQIEMKQIDITPDYKDWVSVGFALKDSFGESGESYFLRLSNPHKGCKQSDAKKQYAKCMKAAGHGISIATFFHFAKDAGLDIVPPKKKEEKVKQDIETARETSPHDPKASNPCQEIQSEENGSLDLWISGSEAMKEYETTEVISDAPVKLEEAPSPSEVATTSPTVISAQSTATLTQNIQTVVMQEIQKSKNPEIQSRVVGPKWILEEDELPRFPQFIYDSLPPFLHEVVSNSISDDDRDMLLMGSLTCLSATLHNIFGKYHKDYSYPMLYFFVMAEAGMGKGEHVIRATYIVVAEFQCLLQMIFLRVFHGCFQ